MGVEAYYVYPDQDALFTMSSAIFKKVQLQTFEQGMCTVWRYLAKRIISY